MPDPVACLRALVASCVISALMVSWLRFLGGRTSVVNQSRAFVLAFATGAVAGFHQLGFAWPWPPANALNRCLAIIFPVVLLAELLLAVPFVRHGALLAVRTAILCIAWRILLHDSVYLTPGSPGGETWTWLAWLSMFFGSSLVLPVMCVVLTKLTHRISPVSVPISLALTVFCTGLSIALGGYLQGGLAAVPLAAAMAGSSIPWPPVGKQRLPETNDALGAAVFTGFITLVSLLLIGRFFGRLSTGSAFTLLLTPLLCWISEIPVFRITVAWRVFAVRLLTVAIPLAVVLYHAKGEFDRKMAPLLAIGETATKPGNL